MKSGITISNENEDSGKRIVEGEGGKKGGGLGVQ